ncbi:putative pyridoxal-dependent decarboxylase domain-containing protein 2 [Babylonia areolata]|uniref:putative pyridoxal-dependent decarboxylase domain-containing protein 2 n=1 Tax=Babylonia areolata TaxID=304850 RepID=UPI003FD2AE5F
MAAPSTSEAGGSSFSASAPLIMGTQGADGQQAKPMISTPFGSTPATDVEAVLYSKMINPIVNNMEKTVMGSSKILDRINRQMDLEREERIKKSRSEHIPEILKGGGEAPDAVLRKVEQLIFFAQDDEDDDPQLQDHIRLQELDPEGKTSLVANSLKAYMSMLPEAELKRVTTKINADCQLWLSRLFRFEDACVMYHDDEREGLMRVCRLALYLRYPKYATDGFDALYSRPPVIYLSGAAPPELGQYLCLQLGLPLSCISTVPCNTVFGAGRKMDVAMLEKLIQDDVAAAKTPVLLLAYAGTPVVGHVDNVQRLQEICQANSIWLHLEGNSLATLTLFSEPSDMSSTPSGDSITVTPGPWLGVPGLPSATLFKPSDITLTHAAGLNTFNTTLKLNCLPVWMSLLTLGHEGFITRVTHACDLAKRMCDRLDQISSLKQISRAKNEGSKVTENRSVTQTFSKAVSPLMVFEMTCPTVVFRYAVDLVDDATASPFAVKPSDGQTDTNDNIYFDALNIWLQEALESSDPKVVVEIVEVEKEGVCIRFSPLETAQAKGTTEKDVEEFVNSLLSNLSVLNASTKQRKVFQSMVQSQPNLSLVSLSNWAGLGAVSYTPDMFLGKDNLNEEELETIDTLNYDVLQELKAKDTAFSIGETESGRICVKFGLITEDTNVQELVELVQLAGREIEESSKFMESMTEMIQKGIQEANQELRKEQENKLLQEGVLRQIPMVSSMLNWLAPIKEEVKGRSFQLTSGKVTSTQDTYRYHMQVQEEGPTPSFILGSRSSRSSRTSSVSSSTSATNPTSPTLPPEHIGTKSAQAS